MELTHQQRAEIAEHGYVRVPGVVPKVMVDAALRAINHSLGEGVKQEDMAKLRAQSFCPELQPQPVITDLFNKTPAFDLVRSVVGDFRPITSGQLALRFPSLQDPPGQPHPHLDGMYSPHNGVPKGTIQNFTMLVGVMLSDLTEWNAGNLAVWPGTHRLYEKYFQEHGPEALLNGMPPIDMPDPVQLTGKAGDLVLCHYQLAHGVSPNVSPHTRYAIYFRVMSAARTNDWKKPMTDIWLEWPGMRSLVEV